MPQLETSQSSPDSVPQYSVSIWETIAIATGAVLLTAIGLAGLGVKALNNAFHPGRSEAIARSILTYTIPGGSQGVFGTNLGGARVAVVTSNTVLPGESIPVTEDPLPTVELLVAQIPVSQETLEIEREATSEFFSGFSFSYQVQGAFEVEQSQTEYREFCGAMAPVTVQTGKLTLPEQAAQVPAMKYEMNVDRDQSNYIAILVTVGQDADRNAEAVFQSLECIPSTYNAG
jgi:hypothetical protein